MFHEDLPGEVKDTDQEIVMEPASLLARFLNFIIDRLIILMLAQGVMVVWIAIMQFYGRSLDEIIALQNTTGGKVCQVLVALVLVLSYYTSFETATRGRTIGKLLTASIAVKEDGNPLTFKEAFLRSLCRLIPFVELSALGNAPWHDTITKTVVIRKTW
jgi:uncharacterized RDD family membrane protein YckC